MSKERILKVMIGSIGRRVYLTRWFEEALKIVKCSGEIHVTDADVHSAGMNSTKFAHVVPRYEEESYREEMLTLFSRVKPDLFFSVNDFELELLARSGLALELEALGTKVLSLGATHHAAVHDKYLLFKELSEVGINTPQTALLSNLEDALSVTESASHVVVKDRYGSGSAGLRILTSDSFQMELQANKNSALYEAGSTSPGSQYVVQPAILGQEYGIDIVAPILPRAHEVGVLARLKTRMRSGETDQAISVEPSNFQTLGAELASWTRHRGLIDADLIIDPVGNAHVIDINPRFGGGYPFNHLAGAHVPALYLAQLVETESKDLPQYLAYESGIRSSKFEEMTLSRQSF